MNRIIIKGLFHVECVIEGFRVSRLKGKIKAGDKLEVLSNISESESASFDVYTPRFEIVVNDVYIGSISSSEMRLFLSSMKLSEFVK